MSFVNVYYVLCLSFFPFGFEGGLLVLIVLLPNHCFSFDFVLDGFLLPNRARLFKTNDVVS